MIDLGKIQSKRSYRGRIIIQIYDSSKDIFTLQLGAIDPANLDKKIAELNKHFLIYEATQERFEEISLDKETFNWEDESSRSQTIRNEQQAIIGKFETLRRQVQMYEINDYKKILRPYEDHPEFEEIRLKLVALSKEVYDKNAEAQVVSKTTLESSTAEDIKPRTSKVRVSLPTFDGSSLYWKRFHDLFTAIIDKDTTLTDGEKSSLLINAMDNEEAKELVKASTLGSDGYKQGLQALKTKYGRDRIVYREHLMHLQQVEYLIIINLICCLF